MELLCLDFLQMVGSSLEVHLEFLGFSPEHWDVIAPLEFIVNQWPSGELAGM